MKTWATTLAILAVLSASPALAEDFKTIKGKVYKDATVVRVEADGILLRTKTGISKVYFFELSKEVQQRFFPIPVKTVARPGGTEPMKVTPKQDESRKADEAGGSATALPRLGVYLRVLSVGSLIITGLVLVFIRSRF